MDRYELRQRWVKQEAKRHTTAVITVATTVCIFVFPLLWTLFR